MIYCKKENNFVASQQCQNLNQEAKKQEIEEGKTWLGREAP